MTFRHLRTLFWIAFFLLAAELALEFRAVRRGWDAVILTPFMSGSAAASEQAGGGADGAPVIGPQEGFPFRSPLIEAARTPDALRLWVASSSYGYDSQLPADKIFPNLVGDNLNAAGRQAESLNASADGWTLRSNIKDLRDYGAQFQPDVVVLYQMSNDIDFISSGGGYAPESQALGFADAGSGGGSAGSIGAADSVQIGPNISALYEQTTVFKNIKSLVTARLAKARVLRDSLKPEEVAIFEDDLTRFIETVEELGAQPVLCLFATSHTADNLNQLPSEYELNLLRFNIELSMQGWLSAVDSFNAVIARVAADRKLPLVDLRTPLAGQSKHFRDFWHFKASGHEIAARTLSDALFTLSRPQ